MGNISMLTGVCTVKRRERERGNDVVINYSHLSLFNYLSRLQAFREDRSVLLTTVVSGPGYRRYSIKVL